MKFDSLIAYLEEGILDQRLPGKAAHEVMMATAITGKRLNFRPSGAPKLGAVLILFFEEYGQACFALIQRPDYDGTHGGQVSFPGGKKELEDPDLITTALRETAEEIGVPMDAVKVMGKLSEYYVAASNHMVLPVIGYMEKKPTFIPDDHEVAEVFSVPLADLLNPDKVKVTELSVGKNGFRLKAPYFDFNDKIVWGATAGILSELKTILLNKNR